MCVQALLDTSRSNTIIPLAELELPKDEDCPASLAIVLSTESSMTAMVGVNDSEGNISAGRNKHCRLYRLNHSPTKTHMNSLPTEEKASQTEPAIEPIARNSFFKAPAAKQDFTYQRITRVSPLEADGTPRLAVIATGDSLQNEIVVLMASNLNPAGEVARIDLGKKEAVDLDIDSPENDEYPLIFCTDGAVYGQKISKDKAGVTEMPASVLYETPPAETGSPTTKNRLLRFLAPRHLLLVQNTPQHPAELLIMKTDDSGTAANVTFQKRLSKISKASCLAVGPLPKSSTGDFQIVIAVAGAGTIEILKLDYSTSKGLGSFSPVVALNAHANSITGLNFSNFIPPAIETPDTRSLSLASVSVDGTVSVQTIPLQRGKSRNARYVLAKRGSSEITQAVFSVAMAALVIAIASILLQAFSEIRGAVPPTLGAADWLSPRVKQLIYRPYIFGDGPLIPSEVPVVATVKQQLHDLVAEHTSAETPKAIVVRDGGNGELSTEVRHNAEVVHDETLRKWEDLPEQEKEGWKQKLSDTGHWTASQGENVLKGILFSEWAGMVGGIVGAA